MKYPLLSEESLYLERKIFKVVLLVIAFFSGYAVLHDLFVGSSFITLVSDIIAFTIIILFGLLNYILPLQTATFIFFSFITLVVTVFWFLLGGLRGPDTYNFIALIICVTVLLNQTYQYILLLSILFIQAFLVGWDMFYTDLSFQDVPKSTRLAMPFHFLFSSWGILFINFYFKISYNIERQKIILKNKELDEKNQEINAQNEELYLQRETIQEMNFSLEQKIKERTSNLEEKNKQFRKYAFLNAHKLRGPLARASGALYLLQEEHILSEEVKEWAKVIQESLKELDQVVYTMNRMLEDEDIEDEEE